MDEKTIQQRNNLDRALGQFIEAMRLFVPVIMEEWYGRTWDQKFYENLSRTQQEGWSHEAKAGKSPSAIIDFHHLKSFALKEKDNLKELFKYDTHNLPTEMGKIANARHMLAHYDKWDSDKAEAAFLNMITIAKTLEMSELEQELRHLKDGSSVKEQIIEKTQRTPVNQEAHVTAWFNNVKPHLDIQQGNLDESVFAANLEEVHQDKGRAVYTRPSLFFDKTYFTAGLTTIANRVIKGLNGNEDGENRVISLKTGFGGGKTHTLISLYHIAKAGKNLSNPAVLKKLSEAPTFEPANIAVFTNTTNDPVQGRKVSSEGPTIHTLWGEIAYQLGGQKLYDRIAENDRLRSAPKGLMREIIASAAPCLILVDELADYCVSAAAVTVGGTTLADQTISFVQELSETVASIPNAVAVITLPASEKEVASSAQGAAILDSLQKRLKRIGADTQPVADSEIYEVIRYRLFEGFGDEETKHAVIDSYLQFYEGLKGELPSYATTSSYKDALNRAYPFHPELIDIFKNKWASHSDFQRTRGVLRILGAVVSDLWKRRHSLIGNHSLIHPSHLNLQNLNTLTGEVTSLYGNGYSAVLSADIAGSSANAQKIDQEKETYGAYQLAQGIASTIYLNTFGTMANKGVSVKELKLQIVTPKSFNHNTVNSCLDELQSKAYYLYYDSKAGPDQRFWFHTKPNLNILIYKSQADIQENRIATHIISELQDKARLVQKFRVLVTPSGDIPEQKSPTLVILSPEVNQSDATQFEDYIANIATKKGSSDRLYRNTILFLSADPIALQELRSAVRALLACFKIQEEYRSTLEEDQKKELRQRIDQAKVNIQQQLVNTYTKLHKYTAQIGIQTLTLTGITNALDKFLSYNLYQQLLESEWVIESIGYNLLKRNNLIPLVGQPISIKSIYEAYIRFDDKIMISDSTAITKSIVKYARQDLFRIGYKTDTGDWTKIYAASESPMSIDISDDNTYIVAKEDYQAWIARQESSTQNPFTISADSGLSNRVDEPAIVRHIDNQYSPATPDHPKESLPIINKIRVSGKVKLTSFHNIFNSFINPLRENDVEIEIKITARSKPEYPITKNSNQYKIPKESASQLGLDFQEE